MAVLLSNWRETPSADRARVMRYDRWRGAWRRCRFGELRKGDVFRKYDGHRLLGPHDLILGNAAWTSVALDDARQNWPHGYGCACLTYPSLEAALRHR